MNGKMLLRRKIMSGIALFSYGQFGSTEGLDLPFS